MGHTDANSGVCNLSADEVRAFAAQVAAAAAAPGTSVPSKPRTLPGIREGASF